MACKLFILTVLFILPCAIAQERIVTTGRRVYQKCDINSTQDVTWSVRSGLSKFIDIYTCQDNISSGQCRKDHGFDLLYDQYSLQVNRSNKASILSLIPFRKEDVFLCKQENGVVKTFTISLIDSANIAQYCNVSLQSISGDPQVTLSCGFTFQETLEANLTLKGLEQNNFTIRRSSHGINGTILFEYFNNIHDAYCEIYFPDIDETRSCNYPNVSKNRYTSEGNEIVIKCDVEYDVDWYLMDLYGRKEDIKNRSWIQDGGRSLLIRDVSEQDVGKVVVCQTKGDDNQTNKGTIAFTVISKMSGDNNKSNSENPAPVSSADNHYFVLTLLFLSLWFITTAVFGVWFGCRPRRSHDVSTISRTSDDEQTQTTPEYATVILNTSVGNDFDTQGPSSGGLGLTGEEPEGERKKALREDSQAHYMDLSGNHGPTEYESLKNVTYENPKAVPEGSSQVDSGSADGITMGKGPVMLEGSKAYYMDMSGNHGSTDYEAMKSLTYANI